MTTTNRVGGSPKDNDGDYNYDEDDEIVLRPGPGSKKHRKRGTDALKTGESVLKASQKK